MSEERRAQLASLQVMLAAAEECLNKVTTSLDLQPRPWQRCATVSCPINPEHRVKGQNLPRHAAACRWQKLGYLADDVPLPGGRGDLGLVITNEDACCIIQEELSKNPSMKTGPAAVGELVEGCEPETWQRMTVDFTPDERRAVYDHVVTVTAPQRIPLPPELAFLGPYPVPHPDSKNDKLVDSLAAKMAAERDARRRRVSQKKVSTNRKSHLEVLREVIGNQMQLYCEWLGDETADTTATSDWSEKHCDPTIMESSSSRISQRSVEAVDHRAKEQIQNQEHDSFSYKGMDDRGRKWRKELDGECRGGVRFREGNVRNGDRDRKWDGGERYRDRGSAREDDSRHRKRERDLEVNQGQRESYGGFRGKDGHRERDRIWEDKDRHQERSGYRGDKDRYKERAGGKGDKDRLRDKERDVGSRGSRVENMIEKYDARFCEEKDRSGERNKGYNRLVAERDVSRDRYSGREWEEQKESMESGRQQTRSEKVTCVVVKIEQDSHHEATDGQSSFHSVGQIKTERDCDYEVGREKRKRDKDYNWSEDSEDTKKQKKKKKRKKHKKHKKKRARSSSSESESS